MKFDYKLKNYSFFLLFVVLALNTCGILVVRSASGADTANMNRQIMGTLVGLACCIVVSLLDYTRIIKLRGIIYLSALGILAAVLVMGAVHKGAGRWIVLPLVGQIQPAEFVKAGIILFFGGYFDKYNGYTLDRPLRLLITLALFAVPTVLVLIEPNLSTTILFTVIFFVMLFTANLSYKWIIFFVVTAALLIGIVYYTFTTDLYKSLPLIKDYQKDRILGFLYPEQYSDTFIQQKNSIIAIASGGLEGKGLYNTNIDSVKSGNFLIEDDTDFIFAIIGEELGFRGCLLILIGYTVLIFIILRIGSLSKDMAGRVICAGVAGWIGFQTFTNIAVATAIFPNTGVTLPFISRGLSSLLSLYLALGFVLNIGLQRKTF